MRRLITAIALTAGMLAPIAANAGVVQTGGTSRIVLTASSPTVCTSIEVNPYGGLGTLINTGAAQTGIFVQFYDEGANPTCNANDVIFGNGSSVFLGLGQVIMFNVPLNNGLAYKITGGPLTSNLIVAFQ